MDQYDRNILKWLQIDATLSVAEIADRVGLSQTPCWRRIKRLGDDGVITARAARLDPKALNLRLTAFISVRTRRHDEGWLEMFAREVSAIEEIVEIYRMSGDIDYLLKVMCPDIESFDRIYKRLIAKIDFSDVSSHFAMETIKAGGILPLRYVE